MIDILETVSWWILASLFIVGIGFVVYKILCWLAKENVKQQLAAERAKLAERISVFEQKEQRCKNDLNAGHERLVQQNAEIKIKQEQATATLMNAEKIREETQVKLDQLTRENTRLKNDLVAARQRAKRLANRAKTEV